MSHLEMRGTHLLKRMSVSERRMFCLIWLLAGGLTGDEWEDDPCGWECLEDEERLDEVEDAGEDGTREEEEEEESG